MSGAVGHDEVVPSAGHGSTLIATGSRSGSASGVVTSPRSAIAGSDPCSSSPASPGSDSCAGSGATRIRAPAPPPSRARARARTPGPAPPRPHRPKDHPVRAPGSAPPPAPRSDAPGPRPPRASRPPRPRTRRAGHRAPPPERSRRVRLCLAPGRLVRRLCRPRPSSRLLVGSLRGTAATPSRRSSRRDVLSVRGSLGLLRRRLVSLAGRLRDGLRGDPILPRGCPCRRSSLVGGGLGRLVGLLRGGSLRLPRRLRGRLRGLPCLLGGRPLRLRGAVIRRRLPRPRRPGPRAPGLVLDGFGHDHLLRRGDRLHAAASRQV